MALHTHKVPRLGATRRKKGKTTSTAAKSGGRAFGKKTSTAAKKRRK